MHFRKILAENRRVPYDLGLEQYNLNQAKKDIK